MGFCLGVYVGDLCPDTVPNVSLVDIFDLCTRILKKN